MPPLERRRRDLSRWDRSLLPFMFRLIPTSIFPSHGKCAADSGGYVLSRLMGSRTSSRQSALPLKGIRG